MKTTEIFQADGMQAVKLPEGFHFEGDTVSIRREGMAVILEPVKPATWPPGFFDNIRIDDPAFARRNRDRFLPLRPSIEPSSGMRYTFKELL